MSTPRQAFDPDPSAPDAVEVLATIGAWFPDVRTQDAWGDTFLSYAPGPEIPPDTYFVTTTTQDSEYDRASALDRPGVWRLNLAVSKDTFRSLFGPAVPDAGSAHDLSALDTLMPHPSYAQAGWVCVVSPSRATVERLRHLFEEGYRQVVARFERHAGDDSGEA
jgi:hypothetical protein